MNNTLTGRMPLRLNVFMEVGFDEAKPLLDAAFDISAAFANIAENFRVISLGP